MGVTGPTPCPSRELEPDSSRDRRGITIGAETDRVSRGPIAPDIVWGSVSAGSVRREHGPRTLMEGHVTAAVAEPTVAADRTIGVDLPRFRGRDVGAEYTRLKLSAGRP